MKHLAGFYFRWAIFLSGVFSIHLYGQWSVDSTLNTAICTATGNQNISYVLSNGSGGAFITWMDSRSGNVDIYAQIVNSSGIAQWAANGDSVCSAAGDQNNPVAVSDGSGGYIVTWWDTRNSSADIYAQRINGSGALQWTPGGVAICTTAGTHNSPVITSDGSGGAIITWLDGRTGTVDVYAQRINGSGVTQWTANGVLVCTASGNKFFPVIMSDGSGGAFIAWTDSRGINYDIYAQRLNGNGDTLWTANGVVISGASAMQRKSVIVSDGSGGAILAWESQQNGNWDIYAQLVDASGAVQWIADGVALVTASDDQTLPTITSDGSGGAIVAWADFRSGTNSDVYAQHIDASGVKHWGSNGLGVATLPSSQGAPVIVSDGSGGAIIAWDDGRNGNTDIYAQRLNGNGTNLWAPNGIAITAAAGTQDLAVTNVRTNNVIVSDGSGGAILAWTDSRSGLVTDIYAQKVSSVSVLPVELTTFTSTVQGTSDELKWMTATEVNDYGFDVERRAVEPISQKADESAQRLSGSSAPWLKIGFVHGSGTSNSPKWYSFTDEKLSAGTYAYRLKQIDNSGAFRYSQETEATIKAPKVFALSQNYPEPFNPSTQIDFSIPQRSYVQLTVYDALGKEVATLVNSEKEAGIYTATWNAQNCSSGFYFYRLTAGSNTMTRKLILLR